MLQKCYFFIYLQLQNGNIMEIDDKINGLLEGMQPITLEQMSSIRLMNRTDTKFVTNKEKLAKLLELAQSQYYAQSIDGLKVANYMTTYWDTNDHLFYMEHHNKRAPRQKVRVRTYLDNGTTYLEVKTKNNHGRTKKKRIEIPEHELEYGGESEDFVQGLVRRDLDNIHPTVRNIFHRITLVNYGKTERLTIDYDVQFLNYETGVKADVGPLVIIELKRDGNVYSPVLALLKKLRIKPSGFSKYCIGTVMTNRGLKHNLFKNRLVRYSKLAQTKF